MKEGHLKAEIHICFILWESYSHLFVTTRSITIKTQLYSIEWASRATGKWQLLNEITDNDNLILWFMYTPVTYDTYKFIVHFRFIYIYKISEFLLRDFI